MEDNTEALFSFKRTEFSVLVDIVSNSIYAIKVI